jgi:hypothetical protein
MKKILIVVGVLIVIGLLFFFAGDGNFKTEKLVGKNMLVSTFTSSGESTGKILLQVPFFRALEVAGLISIAIDTDGDGSFSESEYFVSDFPVRPQANWSSGYYALASVPITDGMRARITVSGDDYEATVNTKIVEVGELLDLATVTDPENATKGWGISVVYADEDVVEITQEGVPDLTQRKGECAPTAAANSLISLVAKNGGEDLIPGDPLDFIENLKRHMNWTPENGVPPDDFVAGKNRWAAAAGVPIRTTKVGDTHGISTIDAIRDALGRGDGVELRIKFADASLKPAGGHMVTVTGIHQAGGQTYLDINDPATPDSGTETVEIRSNQITNYGPWQGITVLSWGFTQTWEGHPTGALLDTMTDEEIIGIRQFAGETPMLTVIEYNGKYLPTSQLIVEDEEGCGADHWHAARGIVVATDGTQVPDPGPQCGYGKVKDRPSKNIPAPNLNTSGAE